MKDGLAGVIVPAVTPFDEAGRLRLDWFEHNVRRWNLTEVRGLMVLGTNGEFRSLGDDESRALVAAADDVREDLSLIVGVGRESTHLTLAFIHSIAARTEAINYVSILPPHYFAEAMTADVLHSYYTEIADHSPIPVLLYVAPSYANRVVIPSSVVASLANHPNIAGVKDTSTDLLTSYLLAAGGRDDFTILPGTMNTIMTGLYFGARGAVVSAANYFPDECADVVQKAMGGQGADAIKAYKDLHQLIKTTGGRRGLSSLKACMNELGYQAGVPRLPLQALSKQEQSEIHAALSAAGKIHNE